MSRLFITAGVLLAAATIAAAVSVSLPSGDALRREVTSRIPREAVPTWRPLWAISPRLRASVLAWEDPQFYGHSGINIGYIADAVVVDLRERRFARGGSTITQQLAKTLFLTPEKTLRRKLHDALLARRMERALTKDEILETYLNSAFWGDRTYGAEAAARAYFDTSSGALDWAQAALLASLLPNPRAFDPCRDPEAAVRRRNRVLDALERQGEIDTTTHRTALGAAAAASCRR